MKSYEALQKAIRGKTPDFARRLGLSTIMVNKWQEPSMDYTDSGAYNPLDRIETIIEASLATGAPADAAFAPLYYLAERFHLVAIPLPECPCLNTLSEHLLTTIKEFGHLAAAASEAMADGRISRDEFRRIEEEGHDLVRHVTAFIGLAQEAVR